MKKKNSRSELIPKHGTPTRNILVSMVTELPGYKEGIDKGLSLFTSKELDEIKERYKDGLTWEEIDKILSGKGIFFKKATFRKYIQEGNISKAIGYKNTEKSRVAIFPSDTISHINFIRYYYKVMDGELVDKMLDLIKDAQITYLEAIESNLDNIYASIYDRLCFDDGAIDVAIEEALKSRPDDRDKCLKMLDDIQDKFDKIIGKDIGKFVSLLKKNSLSILEISDKKQENSDEQN